MLMDNQQNKQRAIKIILALYKNNIEEIVGDLKTAVKSSGVVIKTEPKFVPPAGAKPLIVVRDLSRIYKNGKEKIAAVNKVSFEVYPGEIVALTGTSGSGKSTLLHMIGGLDKPSSGQVLIDEVNIAKLSDRKLSNFRNRTVGFVFQFFYLQPFLTLAQNIAVPSMIFSMSAKDRRARTQELAEAVGLTERLKHLPRELSGGQMQRAAIARALFNRPKILIADEPTGNLDSTNASAILELFQKIRKEFGTTIIIVTHDEKIAAMADRKLTMHDGELI